MGHITEAESARLGDTRRKIALILATLERVYGKPDLRPHGDLLGELVGTILSQNTSDLNSQRAYQSLRHAFPDWHQVRQASNEEIARVIQTAGLSRQKAPAIRAAVTALLEDGEQRADWLRTAPLDDARAWLQSLPGVGPKTAACVLLFALGRPALPVDTHVFRVSMRLGLLPPGASPVAAHRLLEALVPPGDILRFHVLLIRHGRAVCHARHPACSRCLVATWCEYRRQHASNHSENQLTPGHGAHRVRLADRKSALRSPAATPDDRETFAGVIPHESERDG